MAGAFGVLLAGGLVQDDSQFGAFSTALNAVRAPIAKIGRSVRVLVPDQEFVQRIENANLEAESIFYWGSPSFFQ
jgi:hypothetical protein